MLYSENELTKNPQKTLAQVFGFEKNYKPVQKRGIQRIEKNDRHKCLMCGRIQESGYLDPKRTLIGSNTNDFYNYKAPHSPFLCDYCHYIYSHYKKGMQKDLDQTYGDMCDIVLYENRFEPADFRSTSTENDLFRLLKEPPKEPFALLLKEVKGSTFVNNAHWFLPTIDSELFVVNFGTRTLFVEREKIFLLLEEFETIERQLKSEKIKFSEDLFFNRNESANYNLWLTPKLRGNETFMNIYIDFLDRYDKDTRFIAKIIKKTYDKHRKEKK